MIPLQWAILDRYLCIADVVFISTSIFRSCYGENLYFCKIKLFAIKTRGPADLLLDMGQMRMKPWTPNNELLEKNEILYHLIFIVQFLPPPQALSQFQGHPCVYKPSEAT